MYFRLSVGNIDVAMKSGTFTRKTEFPMQATFLSSDPLRSESQRLSQRFDGVLLAVPTMQPSFDEGLLSDQMPATLLQNSELFLPEFVSIDHRISQTMLGQLEGNCNLKETGCKISRALHPRLIPYKANKGREGHVHLLESFKSRSPGRETAYRLLEPAIMRREYIRVSKHLCPSF